MQPKEADRAEKLCTNCAQQIRADARFCTHCGNPAPQGKTVEPQAAAKATVAPPASGQPPLLRRAMATVWRRMWKRAIIILVGTACGAAIMALWPDRDRESGAFVLVAVATFGGGLVALLWPIFFAFFVMAEWGELRGHAMVKEWGEVRGQQAPFKPALRENAVVNLGQNNPPPPTPLPVAGQNCPRCNSSQQQRAGSPWANSRRKSLQCGKCGTVWAPPAKPGIIAISWVAVLLGCVGFALAGAALIYINAMAFGVAGATAFGVLKIGLAGLKARHATILWPSK